MSAGLAVFAFLVAFTPGLLDPPAPSWLLVRAPPVAHLSPDGRLMITLERDEAFGQVETLTAPMSGVTMARNDRTAGRQEQPDSIGAATMLLDGTIVLDLRAEGPSGMIGDARLTYRPGEPNYPAVRDHLPALRPGMTVMVPPFH